MTRGVDP